MIIELGKHYRSAYGAVFHNARPNNKFLGCPWLLDGPDGALLDFNGDGTAPYPRLPLVEEVTVTDTSRPGNAPGSRNRSNSRAYAAGTSDEQKIIDMGGDPALDALCDDEGCEHYGTPHICVSKPKTTKASLLDAAKAAVADRGLNYGEPEDNFARIAKLWNVHLIHAGILDLDGMGVVLAPSDVAIMMALMKIARLENDPSHLDSWTDLAGYAACGAEISA